MKVINSRTEKRTAYMTVEVEPSEVEEFMDRAYKRMVDSVEIPGFRKGHAPRGVLEQHIGHDNLFEEAKQELMPKICQQAVSEQKLDPLDRPMAKVTQKEPLTIEIIVPLRPTVEIGDYKTIRIQPEKAEVTAEDVDNFLEQMRLQYANFAPSEGPVQSGDIITVNVVGSVMESPVINHRGVQLKVGPGLPSEIPELSEQFIGMKKDEEKEFKLKLPADYPNKLIAEKEATFQVKVTDIKGINLPELDDKLIKSIAPDIESLDEFRQRVEQNLQIEKEQQVQYEFEEKLVSALIERSQLDVSPIMIESEAARLIEDAKQQLRASCKSQEEYESKLNEVPMDKVRDEYQGIAERRIKWNLVLAEVARAEKIDASNDEVAA